MNPNHHEQIKQFLRFFKSKRELQISEISQIFDDVKDSRVSDGDMFNSDEVSQILETLLSSVTSNYRKDLQLTVNMSVLAIKQLYEDADIQEVELTMDTSKIEDAALLEEVSKMHLDAPSHVRRKTGKLVSLRDEQQRLADESTFIRKENSRLRRESESTQDQLLAANTQISNLLMEVESLQRKLHGQNPNAQETKSPEAKVNETPLPHEEQNTPSVIKMQQMLDTDRDATSELRAQLDDAKTLLDMQGKDLEEFTSKIVNSRQFRQLKKMLNTKNDQLLDLRKRMLQYEPEDTTVDIDTTPISPQRHK